MESQAKRTGMNQLMERTVNRQGHHDVLFNFREIRGHVKQNDAVDGGEVERCFLGFFKSVQHVVWQQRGQRSSLFMFQR